MWRREMAVNQGMLFVWPQAHKSCMWMMNTYLPLSVAFIDAAGIVINIEDMLPRTQTEHCAKAPAKYALEMNRGWFARRGIKPGQKIGGLDALPQER
jgi:uncharacterized membrane protein (UPF0127 family)